MNPTTLFPARSSSTPDAESISSLPSREGGESGVFEKLMRDAETDARDWREEAEANSTELGGMGMPVRPTEMNAPLDLPKTEKMAQDRSSQAPTELTFEARVERRDGGGGDESYNQAQELESPESKLEQGEEKSGTESEENEAEGTVQESSEPEAKDAEENSNEEIDVDLVSEMETDEVSIEEESQEAVSTEEPVEPELAKPDLKEKNTKKELIEEEIESTKKSTKTSINIGKTEKTASRQPVLADAEVEPDSLPNVSGTKIAPNASSMWNTARNAATLEPSVEEIPVDTPQEWAGEFADDLGGSMKEFSDSQHDLPQPVLNVQSVSATGQAQGSTMAQFSTLTPQVSALMESIWNRVTTFRLRGDSSWTVRIRPDQDTALQLTIKMGTTGLEVHTRLQHGDMAKLGASWGDLQNALSERGVQLHDLESEEGSENGGEMFDMNMFQNDDEAAFSGEGSREGDENFAPIGPRPEDQPEPEPKPRRAPARSGFEQWA